MDKLSQKQQNILDSLKWEYEEDLPDVPWEYTILEWNKDKVKELEDFVDMLYKTAEPNVLLEEEPYECFTCKQIGDYYYAISEKDEGLCICRTYSNIDKLKKIYNYLKSQHFEYKKGMSLSDIYNQIT